MSHLITQTIFVVHFITFLSTLIACLSELLGQFSTLSMPLQSIPSYFLCPSLQLKDKDSKYDIFTKSIYELLTRVFVQAESPEISNMDM